MTLSQESIDQFDRQLDRLFDAATSAAEHDALSDAIVRDRRLMDRYLDRVDLEAGLAKRFGTLPPEFLAPIARPPGASISCVGRAGQLPIAGWLTAGLSVAAATLLAIGWAAERQNLRRSIARPIPVVDRIETIDQVDTSGPRVTQVARAALFGRSAPSLAERLPIGREWVLTDGMLQLTFNSGAQVIIESPAVLEVTQPERLRVAVGKLSVHAPPGAEGFEILTPEARVIDRGTRFSLIVDEVGETEVQVIEGEAELWPIQAAGEPAGPSSPVAAIPIRLFDGEATRVDGAATRRIDGIDQHYLFALPDRVTGYTAKLDAAGEATDLESITLQRGGRVFRYETHHWVRSTVVEFVNGESSVNVVMPRDPGLKDDAPAISELVNQPNDSLLTGWINPGGTQDPGGAWPPAPAADGSSPISHQGGMRVRFDAPVVNGPGQDMVIVDLQSMIDPPLGDGFHIRPVDLSGGLRPAHSPAYDLVMSTPGLPSLAPFDLLQWDLHGVTQNDLRAAEPRLHRSRLKFWASVVGIDLTSMGVAQGDSIDEVILQDDLRDYHYLDPVLILGLPAAPISSVNVIQ